MHETLPLRGSIYRLGSRFRLLEISKLELVTLTFASWNQIHGWVRRLHAFQRALAERAPSSVPPT
jgi:hypothetical protein